MAGGRIVQYGRRTKRAMEGAASSRTTVSAVAERESSPLDLPSAPLKRLTHKKPRDENSAEAEAGGFLDSPQPKPARRARKMVVSSPSSSPAVSAKVRRISPPAKVKTLSRPTKPVSERSVLAPASGNIPKAAREVSATSKDGKAPVAKPKPKRTDRDSDNLFLDNHSAKLRTAPMTPVRKVGPPKTQKAASKKPVEVDITVVDDAGLELSHEKRVSRPGVVVNPLASPSPSPLAQAKPSSRSKPPSKPDDRRTDKLPSLGLPRRVLVNHIASPTRKLMAIAARQPAVAPSRPLVTIPSHPLVTAPSRQLVDEPVRQTKNLKAPSTASTRQRRPPSRSSASLVYSGHKRTPIVVSDNEDDENEEEDIQLHALASDMLPQGSSSDSKSEFDSSLELPSVVLAVAQHYVPTPRRMFPTRAHPPSPPIPTRNKPRNLTPIRRHQHSVRAPSPPSPTTPTDIEVSFDMDFELQGLDLVSSSASSEPTAVDTTLQPLLNACSQREPYEFSSFISTFPFDPVVTSRGCTNVEFQKIGEASYSEVFGIGDVVLKVVPLRTDATVNMYKNMDVETPPPSEPHDVLNEIFVTGDMGEITPGFVKLLRTYVVRGKYPSALLDLWDQYDEMKGSESIRPHMFSAAQVYAIIVLPNGGPDLEAYVFEHPTKTAWRQACSIFWQVARILASAEDLVSFEHRDLHWGQILVRDVPPSTALSKKKRSMDSRGHGVHVTVIDLGLARMSAHNGDAEPRWTPLDEETFEGDGDYQFDIYRLMREHHGNNWSAFRPLTNVMWLHYLARKLLESKGLRAPPTRKSAAVASSEFSERSCYEALVEVQELLARTLDSIKKPARKGRRTAQAAAKVADEANVKDAREVVEFGMRRGWIGA